MTKPRKGLKYTSELDVLLRDAQPTWFEIENEPDLQKRWEHQRARDIATDELITIYRNYQRRGLLQQPDPQVRLFQVRLFYEQLRIRGSGKSPKRKGGRPANLHKQLLIAVDVRESIAAHCGQRGSVAKAIRETFGRYGKRFGIGRIETIKDIHYNSDPEWRRMVNVELARRRYEAECQSSQDPPKASSESTRSEPHAPERPKPTKLK